MSSSIREALAFANTSGRLADLDPAGKPLTPGKSELKPQLRRDAALIADLQEKLWAESTAGGKRSVLVVMQGIDTSGKGGTTEKTIGDCGPIGVQYTDFKAPTKKELRHDFLWRIKNRAPAPGVLGVFDRSHYEDVLIVRVKNLVPREQWEPRYEKINNFERDLVAHGTTVIKVFLHLSYDKQRERLLRRLRRPDKYWKFDESDIDERRRWPEYQEAFQDMLQRCDTEHAPWYVVPADSKRYRNWAVGRLLRETLVELDPRYPELEVDADALRKRLAPPH
jgi:PPK2 family polyphosphate:nucleotide phosphotransferase